MFPKYTHGRGHPMKHWPERKENTKNGGQNRVNSNEYHLRDCGGLSRSHDPIRKGKEGVERKQQHVKKPESSIRLLSTSVWDVSIDRLQLIIATVKKESSLANGLACHFFLFEGRLVCHLVATYSASWTSSIGRNSAFRSPPARSRPWICLYNHATDEFVSLLWIINGKCLYVLLNLFLCGCSCLKRRLKASLAG